MPRSKPKTKRIVHTGEKTTSSANRKKANARRITLSDSGISKLDSIAETLTAQIGRSIQKYEIGNRIILANIGNCPDCGEPVLKLLPSCLNCGCSIELKPDPKLLIKLTRPYVQSFGDKYNCL